MWLFLLNAEITAGLPPEMAEGLPFAQGFPVMKVAKQRRQGDSSEESCLFALEGEASQGREIDEPESPGD